MVTNEIITRVGGEALSWGTDLREAVESVLGGPEMLRQISDMTVLAGVVAGALMVCDMARTWPESEPPLYASVSSEDLTLDDGAPLDPDNPTLAQMLWKIVTGADEDVSYRDIVLTGNECYGLHARLGYGEILFRLPLQVAGRSYWISVVTLELLDTEGGSPTLLFFRASEKA